MAGSRSALEARFPHVLQRHSRLSQSLLWQLQRSFFSQKGIQAWSEGLVPHYITNNPFIAKAYARVVFGFLRDCSAASESSGETSQPLYIIELGAGTGRFAYYFVTKLRDLIGPSAGQRFRFKYVMTDFPDKTVDSWQSNRYLLPFVEQGYLDFCSLRRWPRSGDRAHSRPGDPGPRGRRQTGGRRGQLLFR